MGSVRGRLLIVDDERRVRDLLRDYFTEERYAVEVAANGVEGLARASHHRPDVVILDLTMPDLDGRDVLKGLRAAHPDVPVIILSGTRELDVVLELTRSGAFDYVTKPFDFGWIRHVVETAMRRSSGTDGTTPQRRDS